MNATTGRSMVRSYSDALEVHRQEARLASMSAQADSEATSFTNAKGNWPWKAIDPTPMNLERVQFVNKVRTEDIFFSQASIGLEDRAWFINTVASVFAPKASARSPAKGALQDVSTSARPNPEPRRHVVTDSEDKSSTSSGDNYHHQTTGKLSNADVSAICTDLVLSSSPSSDATIEGGHKTTPKNKRRYRALKSEQWFEMLHELQQYKREHGNCLVSHSDQQYRPLAQWVKRQRYQYKLLRDGEHSNLTEERQRALEELGFAWSSHGARWEDRFEELRDFKAVFGHCRVPKRFEQNMHLSMWVKCQRRMYKALLRGKAPTTLTPDRVAKLNDLGFHWGRLGGNSL